MASSNHPDDNALGKVGLALFTYAIHISIPDIASGRRLCLGQAGKGYPHWRAIAKPLFLVVPGKDIGSGRRVQFL